MHTHLHRVASSSCSFAKRLVIYNHEFELAYYLIVCFNFITIREQYTFNTHTHTHKHTHTQLQHEWEHWAQPGLGCVHKHLIKNFANHGSSASLTVAQLSTGFLLKDKNKEIPWSKLCGKYYWNHNQGRKRAMLLDRSTSNKLLTEISVLLRCTGETNI